jgi:DNA-binding transcriptional regulator LsrR (DeoR family)
MKKVKDKKTFYKILRLYYIEGITQSKIAERLNLTRIKVARYLYYARDNNLVETKLKIPVEDQFELETEIERKYKLKECRVVSTFDNTAEIYRQLGKELSDILDKVLSEGSYIGVSWSLTLQNIAEYLDLDKKIDLNVIPIIGGLGISGEGRNSNFVAKIFADKIGGKSFILNAPAVVENIKVRDAMIDDINTKSIIDLAKNISTVITGIGDIRIDASVLKGGFFKKDEVDLLRSMGAVGSINLTFIDKDGKVIRSDIDDKVIKIFPVEKMKKIKNVIGIAFGEKKVEAIKASLGNIINILITDNKTAESLV